MYFLEISKNFSKKLIFFEIYSLLNEKPKIKQFSKNYMTIVTKNIQNLKYSITLKSIFELIGSFETKIDLYNNFVPDHNFYIVSKTKSICPRELASYIFKKHGISGSVKGQRTEYYVIEQGNKYYVLRKLFDTERKSCLKRGPKFRPFSRSGTLNSELARLMVNTAKCYNGCSLLDPFCGSGSILIEAFFNRCHGLGLDYDIKMIKGCIENLSYFNIENFSIGLTDSTKFLKKLKINFNAIVTDPPYGRSTSPRVLRNTIELLEDVVYKGLNLLSKNGRIVLLISKNMYNDLNIGLKEIFRQDIYVHSSLTRTLVVYIP